MLVVALNLLINMLIFQCKIWPSRRQYICIRTTAIQTCDSRSCYNEFILYYELECLRQGCR